MNNPHLKGGAVFFCFRETSQNGPEMRFKRHLPQNGKGYQLLSYYSVYHVHDKFWRCGRISGDHYSADTATRKLPKVRTENEE